jgi:hypothetical protein
MKKSPAGTQAAEEIGLEVWKRLLVDPHRISRTAMANLGSLSRGKQDA